MSNQKRAWDVVNLVVWGSLIFRKIRLSDEITILPLAFFLTLMSNRNQETRAFWVNDIKFLKCFDGQKGL